MISPAIPFLIALLVALFAGKPAINALKAGKTVQPISPDAPEKHRLKHGTPTMGGLFLCTAVVIGCIPFLREPGVLSVLVIFLAGAVIGFMDDLGKARKKENKAGLSERVKLGMQLLASAIFVGALYYETMGRTSVTTTIYPGFTLDLGWFYWPLAFLFVAFFGNAVNFTDGLDGLASGVTAIVALTLALLVSYTHGTPYFYLAVAGACAGFLYWNAYPARVFMGDTGSQALGMGMAAAALTYKQEILFLIIGAIYLAEIGSMMLQRYVFKYRRIRFGIEYAKANRVFRRAPLHHHFEELGWHETQVVTRFYVLTLIAAAIGVLLAPYVTYLLLERG
jgi:phospho-N-acetylmuramoyl-pentapeptide-transferase